MTTRTVAQVVTLALRATDLMRRGFGGCNYAESIDAELASPARHSLEVWR